MKRGKKIMLWILGIIGFVLLVLVIWFIIPYSPVKSEFDSLVAKLSEEMDTPVDVFTEEDIAKLPEPVQKHFSYCGYLGTPKMANMKAHFNDVDFVLSPDKPQLKMTYTQYNFAEVPERIAYMDTSMFRIPFEGLDAYVKGEGSMKGVLGKAITLFNQKGEALDSGSLVTILAEALLIPNVALQDYISWEAMDETHAKATISYFGISADGIFTFNEDGAMVSFTTDDRENVDTNGNVQEVKWTVICGGYQEKNGIKYPSSLKAVWHYDSGDLVYFDGRDIDVEYDVKM